MDRQEALKLYAQEILRERENFLEQCAVRKVRPVTGRMTPQEKKEYLRSQAFENTVYQIRRRDKVYQALLRGELTLDYHQTEFELLEKLILEEAEQGRPVNLPFLRSVEKSRLSLPRARAALGLIEKRTPELFYRKQFKRLAVMADTKVEDYLLHGPLTASLPKEQRTRHVADNVEKRLFGHGITEETVRQAFFPQTLASVLQRELERTYPELKACGRVVSPGGESLSSLVAAETARACRQLCAEIRIRYPKKRISGLIERNDTVKRLQKKTDAEAERERRLRDALLQAVPEHVRDLYPLARQMRRHFYLHLPGAPASPGH